MVEPCLNKVIDCTGTGQDGESQKGVAWPNPRFTDNGDGTVTDNLTGLMWLKDANCIATNYPSFDKDYAPDGEVTWLHAIDFVAGINDGTYPLCGAGFTDWRLPNRFELQSLSDLKFYEPALPDTSGKGQSSEGDPFNNVQYYSYWSSTTYALLTHKAWSVGMTSSGLWTHEKTLYNHNVWPVRGGH
jgi:hypothetical protein